MEFVCDNKRHLLCLPYGKDQLHAMAQSLEIKRGWYHSSPFPHYDIPKRRLKEIMSKCRVVNSKEIVKIAQQAKFSNHLS